MMLRSFRQCSHEKSLFLASIVEPEDGVAESAGMEWVGRSHESAAPGIARYRFTTIEALCREESFAAERLRMSDGQLWVKIGRQS
jgi:hypothetical protein